MQRLAASLLLAALAQPTAAQPVLDLAGLGPLVHKDAFDCPAGTPMLRAEDQRILIW